MKKIYRFVSLALFASFASPALMAQEQFVFDDDYYDSEVPMMFNAYAEVTSKADGSFVSGTTEYDLFGTDQMFGSAEVDGVNALTYPHPNAIDYGTDQTRTFYLVSPLVGGEFQFEATALQNDAYINVYTATYDIENHTFTIGEPVDLIWQYALEPGSWSIAGGQLPDECFIAFEMQQAAISSMETGSQGLGFSVAAGTVGVSAATPSYFSITGTPLADAPAKGIYIMKEGPHTAKLTAR